MDPSASLTAPLAIRKMIRAGDYTGPTNGFVPEFIQCNVVILPEKYAYDFQSYCLKNQDCCPLLHHSEVGQTHLQALGNDIDIRTDIPRYRVLSHGQQTQETTDIKSLWQDDFVTFFFVSYLAFNRALDEYGLFPEGFSTSQMLPMYLSNLDTISVGDFHSTKVVCMRPLTVQEIIKSVQIATISRAPHSIPLHFGTPSLIGIDDLSKPNFGDPIDVDVFQQPVFWTSSLTAHIAITKAMPDLCIINSPQHLLVTDLPNLSLAVK